MSHVLFGLIVGMWAVSPGQKMEWASEDRIPQCVGCLWGSAHMNIVIVARMGVREL